MRLKDYQVKGVQDTMKILKLFRVALLADEMGLGKTAQAIEILKEAQPSSTLIVCPASLTYNWKNEIALWLKDPKVSEVVSRPLGKPAIQIVSYTKFTREAQSFIKRGYKFIIFDEAHYIKSPDSKRTKAAIKLIRSQNVPTLLLTGTPITSYTRDLYVYMHLVFGRSMKSSAFKTKWNFYRHFCGMKRTPFGWDTTGTSNAKQLKRYLREMMVRRKKDDVLTELPDKIRSNVPIDLDSKKAFEFARESLHILDSLKELKLEKLKLADHVATARRRLGECKLKAATSFIHELIEQGEKPVIFAVHKDVLNHLKNWFMNKNLNYSYIDGSVASNLREEEVRRFQTGEVDAFIGQIHAAGTGITLTEGTCCVFVESDWNPGTNAQAEDRIHRIGQKQAVNIYYLSARNSLDYSINKLLIEKADNIKNLVDENDSRTRETRDTAASA